MNSTNDMNYISNPLTAEEAADLNVIELLFFSYRDFTADPDLILEKIGFGRAHHRVLYFINRKPGMTVAELLEVLRITKQSLSRVLKQLIDTAFTTAATASFIRPRAAASSRLPSPFHSHDASHVHWRTVRRRTGKSSSASSIIWSTPSGAPRSTSFLPKIVQPDTFEPSDTGFECYV